MLPIGASDLHVPCPSFLDLVLLYMAIRRGSLFEKRNSVNICALWAGGRGDPRGGGCRAGRRDTETTGGGLGPSERLR